MHGLRQISKPIFKSDPNKPEVSKHNNRNFFQTFFCLLLKTVFEISINNHPDPTRIQANLSQNSIRNCSVFEHENSSKSRTNLTFILFVQSQTSTRILILWTHPNYSTYSTLGPSKSPQSINIQISRTFSKSLHIQENGTCSNT